MNLYREFIPIECFILLLLLAVSILSVVVYDQAQTQKDHFILIQENVRTDSLIEVAIKILHKKNKMKALGIDELLEIGVDSVYVDSTLFIK